MTTNETVVIPTIKSRLAGALYGALVGDALGVPVEFDTRAALRKHPVKKMEGWGAWNQPRGTWSDDGALTLASAWTLTQVGMDYHALADSFLVWWRGGFMCAGESYFDIGGTTRAALSRWAIVQTNLASGMLSADPTTMGGDSERDNGNGSLMRIMPVALWSAYDDGDGATDFPQAVENASAITHRHMQSRLACVFYAFVVRKIIHNQAMLDAVSKQDLFDLARNEFLEQYNVSHKPQKYEMFWRVTNPTFAKLPKEAIKSGGYVIDSLEASLWCWLNTTSYKAAVLKAVNLGGDTDTTGCITGALAGLYYGFDAVPERWRQTLQKPTLVAETVNNFVMATLHHWEAQSE